MTDGSVARGADVGAPLTGTVVVDVVVVVVGPLVGLEVVEVVDVVDGGAEVEVVDGVLVDDALPPSVSQGMGSVGVPLTRTSKCRWGPVEYPVVPISPIT